MIAYYKIISTTPTIARDQPHNRDIAVFCPHIAIERAALPPAVTKKKQHTNTLTPILFKREVYEHIRVLYRAAFKGLDRKGVWQDRQETRRGEEESRVVKKHKSEGTRRQSIQERRGVELRRKKEDRQDRKRQK